MQRFWGNTPRLSVCVGFGESEFGSETGRSNIDYQRRDIESQGRVEKAKMDRK